jgi:hypothetical protein
VDEAGWEQTTGGGPVRFSGPPQVRRMWLGGRRAIGMVKLADVTVISAEFGGVPVVYEPWVTLLVNRPSSAEFCGAYQPAFPLDDTPEAPSLCLRRARWCQGRRDEEGELLIEGDEGPIESRIVFTPGAEATDVTGLVEELVQLLDDGLRVRRTSRESDWEAVSCSIADARAVATIAYSSLQTESPELEPWTERWSDAFSRLEDGIAPDDGCRIGYRASVRELLAPSDP